jgi:ribonuclease HII
MTPMGWVCGTDEAGRGPLAGPVYAAAVVLGPAAQIEGLKDSKKLSSSSREALSAAIQAHALAWAIASASAAEIDALNILQATLLAMQRAVMQLNTDVSEVLVDGTYCPRLPWSTRAIVRGDSLIPEISAASILAKTARDRRMVELDHLYPQYQFARHKGYPTKGHMEALDRLGPTPEHRRSFAPVRAALGRQGG